MNEVILDASALLAFALNEPGDDQVGDVLVAGATISAVNLAEVISKLYERGWPESASRNFIAHSQTRIEPFEPEDAYVAGLLRERTRHLGLSIGDRACLALALRLGAPALTANRAWRDLDVGVEVVVVR